ncbi:hypothetical protein Tco_0700867 [Tanacetum coccineum]
MRDPIMPCNKSCPAFRVKSVGSTAPLEKCCEMRKLDSMSYHARGACLRPYRAFLSLYTCDRASWSIDIDTGESSKSTALGATMTRTGETEIVRRLISTWMAFGGNTRDLDSFGEEMDEITDLHQILEEVLLTERGDGVASIKQRRHDLFNNGVWNLEMASGRGRLKEDLESST